MRYKCIQYLMDPGVWTELLLLTHFDYELFTDPAVKMYLPVDRGSLCCWMWYWLQHGTHLHCTGYTKFSVGGILISKIGFNLSLVYSTIRENLCLSCRFRWLWASLITSFVLGNTLRKWKIEQHFVFSESINKRSSF